MVKYITSPLSYLQSNWILISKWISTALFIFSGAVLAFNVPFSKWGFVTFLIAHLLLVVVFSKEKDYPMLMQNGFFIIVDVIGIYRWFIR